MKPAEEMSATPANTGASAAKVILCLMMANSLDGSEEYFFHELVVD
jgi:hypothetical protein